MNKAGWALLLLLLVMSAGASEGRAEECGLDLRILAVEKGGNEQYSISYRDMVYLSVINSSDRDVEVNPYRIFLVDAQGRRYAPRNFSPDLAATLAPGSSRDGFISYSIPHGVGRISLACFSPLADWQFQSYVNK